MPRPSLPGRCRSLMRGSAAPSSSTICPVPSGELSSITRTSACGTNLWISRDQGGDVPGLVVRGERDENARLGRGRVGGASPRRSCESMR